MVFNKLSKKGKSTIKIIGIFVLLIGIVCIVNYSAINNLISAQESEATIESNRSIEEPSTEGYILDGYDDEKINVTANQSHFTFETNKQNKTLKHIDVFLPEELKDDIAYTPCDPHNMICQGENDYFHILNDWTNEYGDKFYIETDYIFDYDSNDGDNDIPEEFNWERINQEIRMNYSENNKGIGNLLNTKYDITEDLSIKTDAFFKDNKLFLNYTYYNNNDIVGNFVDDYDANLLNIKDQVSIRKDQTDFNNLDTKVYRDQAKTQMIKWDGEAVMNVSLTGDNPDSLAIEDGKFIQDYENYSTQFYPLNVTKDGGLEFLVELRNQTQNNVVSFDIEAPNLNFYYQPPLDEEMNNDSCNATHCEGSYRPEDVVGSYAIYHDSKKDNEYKTGKVYHLYRPKIIDEAGNWTWGELDYSNGKLDLEIPQNFLDKASYPVRVDPTFGYESAGGSSDSYLNYIAGSKYTSGGSGTLESISLYMNDNSADWQYKDGDEFQAAIYEDSSDEKVDVTETYSFDGTESNGFFTVDFPSTPADITDQDYWLYGWHDSPANDGDYAYDSGGDFREYCDGCSYDNWPPELGEGDFLGTGLDRKMSIYATYGEGDEEDTTPPSFSDNSIDNSVGGEQTTFQIKVDDNEWLNDSGQWIFSTNNSGTWQNDSAVNFTTTPEIVSSTKTLNSSMETIGYKFYATDDAGNSRSSDTYSIDVIPLNIDLIQPTGDIDAEQNEWFKVILNVSCFDYDCGDVDVTLDPISSSVNVLDYNLIESSPHGLAIDDAGEFVYVAHRVNNKITKIATDSFSISDTNRFGGDFTDIVLEDGYGWVSDEDGDLHKFNLTTLESVSNWGISSSDKCDAVDSDSDFVYISCRDGYIGKVNYSDDTLTKNDVDDDDSNDFHSLLEIGNYLYAVSNSGGDDMYKIYKSNLSIKDSSGYTTSTQTDDSTFDDNFIYTSTEDDPSTIYQINQSNISDVTEHSVYGMDTSYGMYNVNGSFALLDKVGDSIWVFDENLVPMKEVDVNLEDYNTDEINEMQWNDDYMFLTTWASSTSNSYALKINRSKVMNLDNLKGTIPTETGATPFYTNKSENPYEITLNDDYQEVEFWVNATGEVDSVWEFFATAHDVSEQDTTYDETMHWDTTITEAETDSCSCPGTDTNWEIDLSDNCVIQNDCNIGTGNISFINTGTITFNSTITACEVGDLPADQTGNLWKNAIVNQGGSC